MNPTDLSPKMYDFLKRLVQLYLPAFGTLYATVGGLWGLPYVTEVLGTIVAVATFLGVIIGISHQKYLSDDSNFDGDVYISPVPGAAPEVHMTLGEEPERLKGRETITLKATFLDPPRDNRPAAGL